MSWHTCYLCLRSIHACKKRRQKNTPLLPVTLRYATGNLRHCTPERCRKTPCAPAALRSNSCGKSDHEAAVPCGPAARAGLQRRRHGQKGGSTQQPNTGAHASPAAYSAAGNNHPAHARAKTRMPRDENSDFRQLFDRSAAGAQGVLPDSRRQTRFLGNFLVADKKVTRPPGRTPGLGKQRPSKTLPCFANLCAYTSPLGKVGMGAAAAGNGHAVGPHPTHLPEGEE